MKRVYLLFFPVLIICVLYFSGCEAPTTSTKVKDAVEGSGDAGNGLIFSEIGNSGTITRGSWLELYNNSTQNVNLNTYSLKGYTYNTQTTDTTIQTVALPNRIVKPQEYIVLRALQISPSQTVSNTTTSNVIYIVGLAENTFFYWTDSNGSALELLKNGGTADYIRIGNSVGTSPYIFFAPTTSQEWPTANSSLATGFSSANYNSSLARSASNTDTNSPTDWSYRSYATFGGQNNILSDTDADNDGIPDFAETNGNTFAGLDLYSLGARTNQKDIFIEIDYMDSTDKGVIPKKEALTKVVTAFAAKGITIHFDVGDLFHQSAGISLSDYDLGNTVNMVPLAYGLGLSDSPGSGFVSAHDYKTKYMDAIRKQIFHYMLFGYSQNSDGTGGSSGLAELNGNDSIITLGDWGLNESNSLYTNMLINFQAGTIMHEFGHNLGLNHGGNEAVNYKPNYISVMNYLYQLNGLPTIGSNEGSRYYNNQRSHLTPAPCGVLTDALDNGRTSSSFIIGYSDGSSSALDESAVNEGNGFGRTGSTGGVDFNCDDSITGGTYQLNLNKSYDSTNTDTLNDYNDWNNINLIFQSTTAGYRGISIHSMQNSDVQPVAEETDELFLKFAPINQ